MSTARGREEHAANRALRRSQWAAEVWAHQYRRALEEGEELDAGAAVAGLARLLTECAASIPGAAVVRLRHADGTRGADRTAAGFLLWRRDLAQVWHSAGEELDARHAARFLLAALSA